MKKLLLIPLLFLSTHLAAQSDSAMIKRIYDEALTNGRCYVWLESLCKDIGGRLSGSDEAEQAVKYTYDLMQELKLDRVFRQEVMVPYWVRGDKETLHMNFKRKKASIKSGLAVCALGGSIGTGEAGLTAGIVEIHNFEELKTKDVKGKFVFYNRPMDPTHYNTFEAYSGAVNQRWAGPDKASEQGAVGTLVRSMTLRLDDHPHTGSMGYGGKVETIPAAAISTMAAVSLSQLLELYPALTLTLKMNCKTLPDKLSHNVIGELKGSEKPDEIILVSGHLDSWDLGDGAHDDGSGCMQAIEVLRILRALNYTPKRTIRAVMYMNEENGLKGAKEYARLAKKNEEKHIAAIESDAGGFTPKAFGIKGTETQTRHLVKWAPLLEAYGVHLKGNGWGGADINQLKDQGTVLIGLMPENQRYFDYHHAESDTFDKVNKRELELGAAAMAALVYLLDKYGM